MQPETQQSQAKHNELKLSMINMQSALCTGQGEIMQHEGKPQYEGFARGTPTTPKLPQGTTLQSAEGRVATKLVAFQLCRAAIYH